VIFTNYLFLQIMYFCKLRNITTLIVRKAWRPYAVGGRQKTTCFWRP